jgi:DNA-binding SARP family transcriptional activator/TolB-like protein
MQARDMTGRSVLPRVRKTRAILAVLALAAPRPVLRAQLISLLWSRREPQQAKGSLRQALHDLHDALGPLAASLLDIDRAQVALRDDCIEVDIRTADAESPDQRIDSSRLLEDLGGIDPALDQWLADQRGALTKRARARAETALRAADRPDQMAAAAEALLVIDRGHEAAWQALMRARIDQCDKAAALAVFEQCRIALAEAAQCTPSPQTMALLAQARAENEAQPARIASSQHGKIEPLGFAAMSGPPGGRLRVGVAQLRALPSNLAGELAAALAEELTGALARFRWLACVPVGSLANLFGERWTPDSVWRELALDFLLEGTVQQNDEQIRVRTRLLDLRNAGEVVWSSRFDRTVTGILDLQDDIASGTVAQLESRLLLWEGERISAQVRTNPTAHDLLHVSIPRLFRLDKSGFGAAGENLQQALHLDPYNPRILVWLAQWHLFAIGQGWSDDIDTATMRTRELARAAVDLAPDDARALALAGHVRGFIERRPDEALELHERAIAANPNLPLAWSRSAIAHSYAGQHAEARRRAARARSLSPDDPFGFVYEDSFAVPHLLLGEYEEAAKLGARAIAMNPGFSSSYKTQLAALGHLGRREQAAEIRGRLLAIEPGFSVTRAMERSPIRLAEDRARYADGLRLAGLE